MTAYRVAPGRAIKDHNKCKYRRGHHDRQLSGRFRRCREVEFYPGRQVAAE